MHSAAPVCRYSDAAQNYGQANEEDPAKTASDRALNDRNPEKENPGVLYRASRIRGGCEEYDGAMNFGSTMSVLTPFSAAAAALKGWIFGAQSTRERRKEIRIDGEDRESASQKRLRRNASGGRKLPRDKSSPFRFRPFCSKVKNPFRNIGKRLLSAFLFAIICKG